MLNITFEADEGSGVTSFDGSIVLKDDPINEGRQIFLARLELVEEGAFNPDLVDLSELPLAIIAIVDNDREYKSLFDVVPQNLYKCIPYFIDDTPPSYSGPPREKSEELYYNCIARLVAPLGSKD